MKRFWLIALGTLLLSGTVCAQTAQNENHPAAAFLSNASEFATQAGIIGGTAQACGEDLALYNSHVNAAINVLAKTPLERVQAMAAYDKAVTTAANYQKQNHTMTCATISQTFRDLPLMRTDYQQTILPQLAKMNTSSSPAPQPPGAVLPPPPSAAAAFPAGNTHSTVP